MQEKTEDFINVLPAEMVEKIVGYLKPKDLVNAALASKETFFVNAQRKLALNKKAHDKQAHDMSTDVTHGKQAEVEQFLSKLPIVQAQKMLLTTVPFTDYSGRTFNCTAYEYAYWAKDTHMCRMLEKQMDNSTKTAMLKRCEAIEQNGLRYEQHGKVVLHSKHFDFTPLKTALNSYNNWSNTGNYTAMKAAWMTVGQAQRDVPVHVMNEYCRSDRSFDPRPEFDEPTLPRELIYYDIRTAEDKSVFPLVFSDSSGLGVDFALLRGGSRWLNSARGISGPGWSAFAMASRDYAAVSRLDEVRTADLTLSREILRSAEPEQSRGMTY